MLLRALTKPRSSAVFNSSSEVVLMALSDTHRRGGGEVAVLAMPMARDIEARGNPDAVLAADVVDEPRHRCRASRPPSQAAVQADRHHLGRGLALGVEGVESVAQISEEIVAARKALRIDEAHVIGIETVGNDHMRSLRALDPIGQVVRVGIGGILKTAVFENELK